VDPDAVWMVSGVSLEMGVLDEVVIVEGEGAVLGVNLGHTIVISGDFATQLFPNYFGQDLLVYTVIDENAIKCNHGPISAKLVKVTTKNICLTALDKLKMMG